MPAMLSVKPAAGTAAATAGPPETRLAQAGQVVAPSGICAPHVLQNAMEPPMSCRLKTGCEFAAKKKKEDRGQDREICESPGHVFRKHAHLALSAGDNLHRAAATRTEPHCCRHLRGTIRTGLNGSLSLIHCGHLIKKPEQATNEWNQPSALTHAAPDSKFVQIVPTEWRFGRFFADWRRAWLCARSVGFPMPITQLSARTVAEACSRQRQRLRCRLREWWFPRSALPSRTISSLRF